MKTELQVKEPLGRFFGLVTLRNITNPDNAEDRIRYAQALRAEVEGTYANVETRIAFMWMYAYAQHGERGALCKAMGISTRTLTTWRRDTEAYQEGTLKVRTVVIRKSV